MFGFKKRREASKQQEPDKQSGERGNSESDADGTIPSSISQCEGLIKSVLGNSSDIVIQPLDTQKARAMVVYIDGLINQDLLDRDIISPLKAECFHGDLPLAIKTHYREVNDISRAIDEVLQGQTALFYEGSKKAFIVDIKQWEKRSVQTPDSETTILGPKEGFTESLRTNTALLRRKLRTPKLMIESMIIGRQGNTPIGIVYIEGIVNRDVLAGIKTRLSSIDTDAVLSSGSIEQYICKSKYPLVSGIGATQKPDIVAARILEGRVALFCDGTPYVLTIPELFIENLHTSDDYYSGPLHAMALRLLRLIGFFIATLLPGLAVAVITYSQEMMPETFLQTLTAAAQTMPLPFAAEVLILILMFEMLKEAGIRLPKAVGSAITIVGALIIGDSAVKAGIVSAPSVIIVASTAVASFIVPTLAGFVVLYRFLFLFLGGTMGLIGVGVGTTIMLVHLASTESFGVPILSPFSKHELMDSIFRAPLQSMKYRPTSIAKENVKRRK